MLTRRSDWHGALIVYEASSPERIVSIEIDLEGDPEPSLLAVYPNEVKRTGEYWRAVAFKPTVNGTWPLVITVTDSLGRVNTARCVPGITVTY